MSLASSSSDVQQPLLQVMNSYIIIISQHGDVTDDCGPVPFPEYWQLNLI